jgi:uncharacterized protein (DUF433 family)
MAATEYPHVELRDGVAYLVGTQTKVLEVALDRLAHHWDADEMHRQHPHLPLNKIFCALAYYYDHKDEIDRQIAERDAQAKEFFEKLGPSPLRKRLQDKGLVP